MKKFLLLFLMIAIGCSSLHPIHDLSSLNRQLIKNHELAYYKDRKVHILHFRRCGHNRFCAEATGQSSNEMLSHQDLVDNVAASVFSWSSSIAGSTLMTDETTFASHITNQGNCGSQGYATNELFPMTAMSACKYNASNKTALFNSFGSGCQSWTFAGVTGSGLVATAPVCGSSGDFDADTDFSSFTTTNSCGPSGTCEGTSAYTFSISAPSGISAESISFEYKGNVPNVTGDTTNCTSAAGSIALSLQVNSTVVTLPGIVANNVWNSSGSVSLGAALVNGSNTITFTQSGIPTVNIAYSSSICHAPIYANSLMYVDAITVTATY